MISALTRWSQCADHLFIWICIFPCRIIRRSSRFMLSRIKDKLMWIGVEFNVQCISFCHLFPKNNHDLTFSSIFPDFFWIRITYLVKTSEIMYNLTAGLFYKRVWVHKMCSCAFRESFDCFLFFLFWFLVFINMSWNVGVPQKFFFFISPVNFHLFLKPYNYNSFKGSFLGCFRFVVSDHVWSLPWVMNSTLPERLNTTDRFLPQGNLIPSNVYLTFISSHYWCWWKFFFISLYLLTIFLLINDHSRTERIVNGPAMFCIS